MGAGVVGEPFFHGRGQYKHTIGLCGQPTQKKGAKFLGVPCRGVPAPAAADHSYE